MRRAGPRRRRIASLRLCIVSLSLIAAVCVFFTSGFRSNEAIVGAGVLLLSSSSLFQVWQTET